MKAVYVPNYYASFRCIASKCRHSCCVGWEIDVDEEALSRFDRVSGTMGERLRLSIDREADPPCFRLDEQERCPFLNENGLCDLITELGEDAPCQICADHPRFRNVLYDRVELGLGLCCEAAAELILSQREPFSLVELPLHEAARERAACARTDDPDPIIDGLLNARETILAVIQDRARPLAERIRHVQTSLDIHLPMNTYAEWAAFLTDLERLDPAWDGVLWALSGCSDDPARELEGETSTAYEQLTVYFLYRYLASEDDGRPALLQVRTAFAVMATALIHAIAKTTCLPVGEIARMFSSEIEYSEENLERFLDLLEDGQIS